MTIELINVGTSPGDGTGDPIRTAFQKVNDNFIQFAPVSFSGEYNSLSEIPSFATVATTGQYTSLLGLPPLGSLSTLSSINNSNWFGTPLSVNNGGTGQTTSIDAFNAISPISVSGDIIFGNSSGQSSRLSIGANSTILTVVNNFPQWAPSVGPAGYNTQIQFNSNGIFGAATALTYNQTGNYLTITSLATNGIPLNIRGSNGQTTDLIDLTANGGTQGGLAKFTANGSLYIQGSALSPSSLELSSSHFYGQYFQLKTSTGSYGPYIKTVDNNEIRFYQANNNPIWSIGWGDDLFFHRYGAGIMHQHNSMNPCIYRVFNWYQDEDNWEGCGFNWQTETNVCRFGTEYSNGISRELHLITGGIVSAKIDAFQNFVFNPTGTSLLSTANNGFIHLPVCNGIPTGSPTFFDGAAATVVNEASNTLNISINGSWYHVKLTAGAGFKDTLFLNTPYRQNWSKKCKIDMDSFIFGTIEDIEDFI